MIRQTVPNRASAAIEMQAVNDQGCSPSQAPLECGFAYCPGRNERFKPGKSAYAIGGKEIQRARHTVFQADVPTYQIDLEKPEATRWAGVISHEKDIAAALVQEATREFERVPELVRWIFARLYQACGGLYRSEMEAWANALHVS